MSNLNECIIFGVWFQTKKGFIYSLYRSPSQTNNKFDDSLVNFQNSLSGFVTRNLLFVLANSDFNTRA